MKTKLILTVKVVGSLILLFLGWQAFTLSLELMNQPYNSSVFLGAICAFCSTVLVGYGVVYLVWAKKSKPKQETKKNEDQD